MRSGEIRDVSRDWTRTPTLPLTGLSPACESFTAAHPPNARAAPARRERSVVRMVMLTQ